MPTQPAVARTRRTRMLRSAAIVAGVVIPSVILRELIDARLGSGPVADLSALVVPIAATAWLAPYASYRRRDALLWLIGPGIYVFAVIAWRVALAPYRDWSPRPEEKPRMRWSRDPDRAGTWYLPIASGDARHNTVR